VLGVLLGGAGLWGTLATVHSSLASGATSSASLDTLSGRLELWSRSLSMVRDFGLTGIGLGQFDRVLHLLYASDLVALDQFVPHAHNLYLAYAVELGIPGALAFALLVILVFKGCIQAVRSADPLLRRVGSGLISAQVAFLVFGLSDAIAPGARGGLIWWILLGLGAAVSRLSARSEALGHAATPEPPRSAGSPQPVRR
jgi:putative inorganic carbon (HCO3(-)) transporter